MVSISVVRSVRRPVLVACRGVEGRRIVSGSGKEQ